MERTAETQASGQRVAERPPYRLPTLAEVRATPTHGRTVASLFAGAGGSSTGYRLAGFRVLFANEFIPIAADSYSANYPETPVDRRDVRELRGGEILRAIKLKQGQLDVLDGSPPCAAFSLAGRRTAGWGVPRKYSGVLQRVDDLFGEYLRLVDEVRPRVAIAENVAGLVAGAGKGVFKAILERFRAIGYRPSVRILDAQWLGVPQRRRRLFFVAVRKDIDREPAFPAPFPYRYGAGEALAGLPPPGEPIRMGPALTAASSWLVPGQQSKRYFSLIVVDPREPCPTITATVGHYTPKGMTAAGVVHWERRAFNVPEIKRLCSFPDDYVLCGTEAEQAERLGRAVPPLMMRALAGTVAREILDV
jgi:DNA (cytosine-5)-methyltransferase 1